MIIQSLVFSKGTFQPDSNLYYKGNIDASVLILNKGLKVFRNNTVFFDSYFNGFFVKPWIENTNVRNFNFKISLKGNCIISLYHRDITGNEKIVHQEESYSDGEKSIKLKLNGSETGLFYIKINALEDVFISSGGVYTCEDIINPIKMGIIVTHFNRKDYVIPAIDRIKEQLLDDKVFGKKVKLFVIDNSQNIGLPSSFHENIEIINNKNLGGSGGFTRGLMELKKSNDFTHCLFMDDDASCEIDSIKRTISFLMYCNEDIAISGSLFRELETARLVEKGAIFDGMAKPLCHNLLMTNNYEMLLASESRAKPNYGAWWFFAFPINKVKYFPFPFFVRGDDIQFSLLNKFNIVTLMGVGCFGDDFGLKSSPMTRYLDTRHTLVQNTAVEKASYKQIVKNTSRFFFGALLGFNYDSARCASLAINDFCLGIDFWSDNIDMSEKRKFISDNYNNEKMEDIAIDELDILFFPIGGERKLRRLIRIISLQGFLLPKFLLRKQILFQPKNSSIETRATFRASKILHYYEPYKTGYISSYDRCRFFKELAFYIKNLIKLRIKFGRLKKEYDVGIKTFTTEEFWKDVYK